MTERRAPRDRLKNRGAAVTGGGSGIGAGTCHLFAAEGAAVAVADVNFDGARLTAAEISAPSGLAVPLRVDGGFPSSRCHGEGERAESGPTASCSRIKDSSCGFDSCAWQAGHYLSPTRGRNRHCVHSATGWPDSIPPTPSLISLPADRFARRYGGIGHNLPMRRRVVAKSRLTPTRTRPAESGRYRRRRAMMPGRNL